MKLLKIRQEIIENLADGSFNDHGASVVTYFAQSELLIAKVKAGEYSLTKKDSSNKSAIDYLVDGCVWDFLRELVKAPEVSEAITLEKAHLASMVGWLLRLEEDLDSEGIWQLFACFPWEAYENSTLDNWPVLDLIDEHLRNLGECITRNIEKGRWKIEKGMLRYLSSDLAMEASLESKNVECIMAALAKYSLRPESLNITEGRPTSAYVGSVIYVSDLEQGCVVCNTDEASYSIFYGVSGYAVGDVFTYLPATTYRSSVHTAYAW